MPHGTHRQLKREKRARQKRKHLSRKRANLTIVPHLMEAQQALVSGNLPRARQKAETAVRIRPRSPDALNILVRVLLTQRRYDLARPYAERLTEVEADDPWNTLMLAECLKGVGDLIRARDAIRHCLRLSAQDDNEDGRSIHDTAKEVQRTINALLRAKRVGPRKMVQDERSVNRAVRPPAAPDPVPPSTQTKAVDPKEPSRSPAITSILPEDYRVRMDFSFDRQAFDALQAHLPTASSLEDYRLRFEFAHVALQRGFDELLCLSTLQGVDHYWHQVQTVRRVLKEYRGRVLLADEVGLGKTIEAGLVLKEYWLRGMVGRALILVPASLVDQWREEMESKFGLNFATTESPRYRDDPAGFWRDNALVISSIHQAKSRQNFPKVTAHEYDLVIVDEAHCLRNRRSLNWKLVNAIRKKFLLLLSATPVQNDLVELFNLITVLKPGLLKTENEFRSVYVHTKNRRRPKNEDTLRGLLREVMIRNTRSLLELELPRRFASTAVAQPSAQERELYEGLSHYVSRQYTQGSSTMRFVLQTLMMQAGSSPQALLAGLRNFSQRHGDPDGALTALIQLVSGSSHFSKADRLLEIITANPTKIAIFTKYRATLDGLAELCRSSGVSHTVYHGGLTRAEKDHALDLFRREARLLLSTELGGEGHNLQFCHTMVNFDLPWNPMKIEQRIGRLHRIGQTQDVFVFNLCQGGSIEEYLLHVLDTKLNMFQLVIGEMETILGVFAEESDFHEIVMDLWVDSVSRSERETRFERLADRLVEAKESYLQSKEWDAQLFGDA